MVKTITAKITDMETVDPTMATGIVDPTTATGIWETAMAMDKGPSKVHSVHKLGSSIFVSITLSNS